MRMCSSLLSMQLFDAILTTLYELRYTNCTTALTPQLFGGKFDFDEADGDGGGSPNTFDSFMKAFITVISSN